MVFRKNRRRALGRMFWDIKDITLIGNKKPRICEILLNDIRRFFKRSIIQIRKVKRIIMEIQLLQFNFFYFFIYLSMYFYYFLRDIFITLSYSFYHNVGSLPTYKMLNKSITPYLTVSLFSMINLTLIRYIHSLLKMSVKTHKRNRFLINL